MNIDKYKVEWYINDKCNQDCSYCLCDYATSKSGYNKIVPSEFVYNLSLNLLSLGAKSYDFVLLGGEPTIYPDLPGLIEQLNFEFRAREINILISTNAKLGSEYFRKLEPYKENVSIRFSMHPMYYSESWFDTIDYLLKNKFNLHCDVLFDIKCKEKSTITVEKLNEIPQYENLKRSVKAIYYSDSQLPHEYRWKELESVYTQEELDLIKSYNKIFGFSALPKNTNLDYCLVGSNKINIDHLVYVKYFCKYKKEFPSLFYLHPKKFKENLLFIKKCPMSYCQHCKSVVPIQSNTKEELIKIRKFLINKDDV